MTYMSNGVFLLQPFKKKKKQRKETFTEQGMQLEITVSREISQANKDKCHLLFLLSLDPRFYIDIDICKIICICVHKILK